MNIKLSKKTIEQNCGTVAYKSGDAFYRSNKVTFHIYNSNFIKASVAGKEDFDVTIELDTSGGYRASCSCPSLSSFTKDCQHVAAVLIAIKDNQLKGTNEQDLTTDLLSIFHQGQSRSASKQIHFENRHVVNTLFTLKIVHTKDRGFLFAIGVKIDQTKVPNLREFLLHMNDGVSIHLSDGYMFNLNQYCFDRSSDAVIELLINILKDDLVSKNDPVDRLIIPPSIWNKSVELLQEVPLIEIEYKGRLFTGFQISEQILPLTFNLKKTEKEGYHLKVIGLENAIVFNAYRAVFIDGKITLLTNQDSKRIMELKRIVDEKKTNQIPIPVNQLNLFLEKVMPGLKSLGVVNLDDNLQKDLVKTPLVAKLYLDRVSNRLLAGLEFHYDHIVINPAEEQAPSVHSLIVRDVEKEEEIIQLMEDSLFTKTESGYFLHNEELEYDFLYYVVPKLQKLTRVYTTTAIQNRVVKENSFPRIRVKVNKERINWLDFKFEMEGIPDDQIKELLEALEEKRKYYRLKSGSLLSLETKEFKDIQESLQQIPTGTGNLEDGLQIPLEKSLQLLDKIDMDHSFITEESFREIITNINHPSTLEFKIPKEVGSILREYQIHGYRWMKMLAKYGFGGVLADDMGLGKTLQSISYMLSELPSVRKQKKPMLVVCPSSVTYNWLAELNKFAPTIKAVVIDGKKENRIQKQNRLDDQDVVITSYPILRKDYQWFEKQFFHTVFYDEAQAFKNPITQTARAVKKIQADHRFALSGTPIENSLEELWSIFHVVFPQLFLGLQEYSYLSKQEISRRVRPFMLRRLKTDVLDELPKKKEKIEFVDLLPEQKKLYTAYLAKLRQDTLKHLDKDTFRKNKIRILAGLTRLRQICCHPGLFVDGYKEDSAKFNVLLQMVNEANTSGRRVLLFSQFTKMLDIIGRQLVKTEIPYFYLDGQTPAEDRIKISERFNQGERNVFLISLKAGGTGLNLTGADTVILYDSWWNPAVENQAADRAYRIGQKNDVQVIKLISRGTIEEKMNELQEKKRLLIKQIVDSDEHTSSNITEEDIREILLLDD